MAFPLVPCPKCSRHVRDDEPKCPFCQSRRQRRAGAVTVAALAVGGVVWGCESTSDVPLYGMACYDACDSYADASTDASDAAVDAPKDAPDAD